MSVSSKKRNYMDIVREILSLSKDGIRKTNLMIKARLSFDLLKKYLMTLESLKLVEERDRKIWTTGKGMEVLEIMRRLDKIKSEEISLRERLQRLISDDGYSFTQSSFGLMDEIRDLLKSRSISFQEVNGAIVTSNLVIMEENNVYGRSMFHRLPRLIIGKELSVYSDGKNVRILNNPNLMRFLVDVLSKKINVEA
ncbi:hypothetical protein GWK48_06660 [Metallosphaera tengchongensis]|uniref:ArnR1-like winged helix-turn-helix domain-containing protein n=1 Tax=Metallosphaera tengchongensis TaxID=1532350 RepID=A0A6N0NV78_9CREN|nr:winged helix-turn-helix domain-containing protein [Metallosphaera tengchongensis]QKR00097.1 hypothetical protein GWK48_06660 [Metallosphaera tengchongensis]